MGSEPTIQDIARAASVSPSTVSNLLNGRLGRMKVETRDRVLDAMERLDYRPNRIARQLRTGSTSTVGLIVPSVENPFWGSWARAVEGEALRHRYQLFLCNSERDTDRERAYLEELWDSGVRSVILATSLPQLDYIIPVVKKGLQIIAFDREHQEGDPPGIVNLSVDNELGSYMATKHLIDLGHRKIGFISGAIATVSRVRRLAGYRKALQEAKIPFSDKFVWAESASGYGDVHSAELGKQGAYVLLSLAGRPTAFVTVNDMYAIGACAAIRASGLDVPGDVSVVGFDDILLSQLYVPPLTSVRQPLEEMARLALEIILRRGQSEDEHEITPPLAPRLVIRSSTAALTKQ